jgi:PAS domain S-box-containing protein
MDPRPDAGILEALVENSQDQLVYLDRDFNFVWVNRAYAETCRRPREDFIGHNHFEFYPHPENQAIFERVRDTGVAAVWREKPFVFPDQRERGVTYWDWTLRPIKDARGWVEGLVFSLREVTGAVVARERIRHNEERLRLAQTSAHLGIWDWDRRSGGMNLCSELSSIYGVEEGAIRSYQEWRQRVHPEDVSRVEKELDEALAARKPFDLEFRFLHASGEFRWLSARGGAVYDDAGDVVRVLGVNIDITDRKRLSDALHESEQRYRSLFESMNEGHALHEMVFDETGRAVDYRFLEVNPAFGRLTELDPQNVIGRTVREVLPGIEPFWIETYGRVVATGMSERFESHATALGRWYEVFAYRTAPGRFAVSFADITERKKVEEELALAHERARSLARFPEENPDPVLRLGADYRLVYANDAAHSALAPLGALEVGQTPSPEVLEAARRAVIQGDRVRAEVHCGDRVFSMSFCPIGQEINSYGHEITERKRAEEALRENEHGARTRAAELQAVLDTVPAAVWISRDRRGDRIDANRFGAELLRRTPGSNVSVSAEPGERPMNFRPMRYGSEIPLDELPIQAAARYGRESRDYEFDLVFDDGTVRHMLGNATPLRDERGEAWGSVGAFIDITDRKEAENRLREANRRKDDFLGMLSHELRNPLAPISNSIYILEHADGNGERARRAKMVIRRQMEHLTRLVDDLLDVTRIARGKIELRRQPLDLADLVRRTAEDHRSVILDRGVRLSVDVAEERIWVDGDATRLAQVVGNLLNNAAKFTPSGGDVSVSLHRAGEAAELAIRDTGVGIEPGLLPQVFEPFVQGEWSLARTEGGLGLGLALVKGIVELHGGSVYAESAGRQKGSAFVFRLPLGDAAVREDRTHPPADRSPRCRRVLVVDDNRDAAESLADIIEMLGHEAEIAYDGPEAIAKVRASPPEIVFCDLGLPGMSGYEVARVLREMGNRLQIFAVSGYTQPEDKRRAIASGFDDHLAKPPDPGELERVLG